jgi:hypothetical protein
MRLHCARYSMVRDCLHAMSLRRWGRKLYQA